MSDYFFDEHEDQEGHDKLEAELTPTEDTPTPAPGVHTPFFGQQDDKQLRAKLKDIALTMTDYPLDIFLEAVEVVVVQEVNKAQIQLVSELMKQTQGLWTDTTSDGNQYRLWCVPLSVLEHKKQELEGKI